MEWNFQKISEVVMGCEFLDDLLSSFFPSYSMFKNVYG